MSNKPIWSGLFSYSLTERRGLFLLFLLLFILKLLPILRDWRIADKEIPPEIIAAFQAQIDSLYVAPAEIVTPKPLKASTSPKQLDLRLFNPNTITEQSMREFGLPEKLVQNWVNFRNAGGRFYQVEDLQKLYSMRPNVFEQIKPYVELPKKEPKDYTLAATSFDSSYQKKYETKPEEPIKTVTSIDVNQSSELEWQGLPGIGPTYAGKIIRFRESLGGFSSIDQIGDTWYFPDSVFQSIIPYLELSPIYRSIEINQATAEELSAHPYLNSKQAKIICRYRDNYGAFTNIDDVKKTRIINESDIKNLKPYINF